MKFLGFSIKDFKRISVVEMEVSDKGLTVVKGKNEQGKSSLINAVEFLLRGTKVTNAHIVKEGADKTEVNGKFVDNDGTVYEISRILTPEGKMTLKVVAAGKKQNSPQSFLDSLTNTLSFDPRPFVNKTDREKVDTLLKVLKLDIKELDKKIKDVYDARRYRTTEIHRIGKPECPLDLIGFDPEGVPDIQKIYSEGEVLRAEHAQEVAKLRAEFDAKLVEIRKHNSDQENISSRKAEATQRLQTIVEDRVAAETRSAALGRRMAEIHRQIGELNHELKLINESIGTENNNMIAADERIAKGEKYIQSLAIPKPLIEEPSWEEPAFPHEAEMKFKIASVQIEVEKRERFREYQARYKEFLARKDEHQELESKIAELRQEKERVLSSVPMPIQGLEFRLDEDDLHASLWYNNAFSDNWSESQAMRISAALCVKMQPELRCIFIDRGESYDKDNLAILNDWAVENDIQAIITIVGQVEEGEDAIYIEEGVVK